MSEIGMFLWDWLMDKGYKRPDASIIVNKNKNKYNDFLEKRERQKNGKNVKKSWYIKDIIGFEAEYIKKQIKIRKKTTEWTKSAIACYQMSCNCKDCEIQHYESLKDGQCKMKQVILRVLAQEGKPNIN